MSDTSAAQVRDEWGATEGDRRVVASMSDARILDSIAASIQVGITSLNPAIAPRLEKIADALERMGGETMDELRRECEEQRATLREAERVITWCETLSADVKFLPRFEPNGLEGQFALFVKLSEYVQHKPSCASAQWDRAVATNPEVCTPRPACSCGLARYVRDA